MAIFRSGKGICSPKNGAFQTQEGTLQICIYVMDRTNPQCGTSSPKLVCGPLLSSAISLKSHFSANRWGVAGQVLVEIKRVAKSKIPRTWTALKVYKRKYFCPLKGKPEYCIEVLAPWKKSFTGQQWWTSSAVVTHCQDFTPALLAERFT